MENVEQKLAVITAPRHRFQLLVLFCAICKSFIYAVEPIKPNILIFLADNLGYNDISFFGSATTQTPYIDRELGERGLKLNNWNSVAHLCSASRASLLTGKYPIKTGVYPRVFYPDSVYGLLPNETTIAEYLKDVGYKTSIVGKWHLGQREPYLPTNQGFDEWIGIPYHMSGGSIDHHMCQNDVNETMWLPLYQNNRIIESPVNVQNLATRYVEAARDFIKRSVTQTKGETKTPFFLYFPFSHVHQLCAPKHDGTDSYVHTRTCQWGKERNPTFKTAVEEMDWITGQVLHVLDDLNIANDTFVLFTSDNGPWIAEQECAGSKGPFEGRWLAENTAFECTACPSGYVHKPTPARPRRCLYPNENDENSINNGIDGIFCGFDTGLGSSWEANVRMPAIARWPGHIVEGKETMELVSTLDVLPTILSLLGIKIPDEIDGNDISNVLFGKDGCNFFTKRNEKVLFFWRDGFQSGPLPPPYGRFDIAAIKLNNIKAWYYTKSAHYNPDKEVFHDPPLLFDILQDPAEAFPLDPMLYQFEIKRINELRKLHLKSIDWTYPLALERNIELIPCADVEHKCRTYDFVETDIVPELTLDS